MMNRNRRIVLDIIKQIIIAVGLGAVLFWIYRKQQNRDLLEGAPWFIYIFYLCLALYLLFLLYTFRRLFINYALRRFDPGDPESVEELNKIRRFHFSDEAKSVLRHTKNPVSEVKRFVHESGFADVAVSAQGIVYLRKVGGINFGKPKYDRLILTYRPILNVFIVDNILNDVQDNMNNSLEDGGSIRMNIIVLLTDMKLESETLSAGAGIVNYLCTSEVGALFPLLVDLYYGKLFYPLDRSMLRTELKISQNRFKNKLLNLFEPTEPGAIAILRRKHRGTSSRRRGTPSIRKPQTKQGIHHPTGLSSMVRRIQPTVRHSKSSGRSSAEGDTIPRTPNIRSVRNLRPASKDEHTDSNR